MTHLCWVLGSIGNLQLCWKNRFKSFELLWKRLLLMVLRLAMLCNSLIQNPTSINTQHTCVFPYPNEFDKKIPESVKIYW